MRDGNDMTMVQLRRGVSQVSTAEAQKDYRRAASTGRAISDATARTIAAWWQAPAGVGSVLSALQHGFAVELVELESDIVETIREAEAGADHVGGDDVLALRMLNVWAVTRAEWVRRTIAELS